MTKIARLGNNPMLNAALLAYAVSQGGPTVADKQPMDFLDRYFPKGSQSNKYDPNTCSNNNAKARRLKQMQKLKGG